MQCSTSRGTNVMIHPHPRCKCGGSPQTIFSTAGLQSWMGDRHDYWALIFPKTHLSLMAPILPSRSPQQHPGKSSITLANAHRRLAAPLWDIQIIPTQFQSTGYSTKGEHPLGQTLGSYTRRTRRQPSTDKALKDMTWRRVRRVESWFFYLGDWVVVD